MKNLSTLFLVVLTIFSGFAQQDLSKDQLIDSIQSILKEKHIPGAFVTVVSKDSILFQEGFGYSEIPTKRVTSTKHLFKIGSISKTFTALAIMKLIEEGKLSLETNLANIAPEIEFKNKWEATHPVKIKHLLEHKAGFDDMHISVIAATRTQGMTAFEEVQKSKGSLNSRWQPGLGHSYSNPGYTILGYLIEKISKQPYQDYIKTEILNPLKMHQTQYRSAISGKLPTTDFAVGYRYANDTITESRDTKIIGEAAGALASNAEEMSHFLHYLLNEKLQDSLQIVSTSTLKEMETLHGDLELENNITNGFGLGIYSRTFGANNTPFLGHSGGINGFASDYIYNKDLDIGIAVSNNGERGNGAIIDLLVDTFTTITSKTTEKSMLDLSKFSSWEGEYRMLTTRNQIFNFIQFPLETVRIKISKDTLFLAKFLQDKEPFVHLKEVAFNEKNNPNPSLFLIEKDEKKYLNYNKDILVPVNSLGFLLVRILLIFSILIGGVLTLTLFANSLIALFKKRFRSTLKRNLILALPWLLFFISLVLFFSNASLDTLETLGQLNWVTISIFLSTLLFPVASLWAAYWLFTNKKKIKNRFFKTYYQVAIFGAFFLSVYCIYHGWFLKMMWN